LSGCEWFFHHGGTEKRLKYGAFSVAGADWKRGVGLGGG
jgi:hypothetical protein